MIDTLPFRLLGESDRETARLRLTQRIQAWIETWFTDKPRAELQWQNESEPSNRVGHGWRVYGSGLDHWVAYAVEPSAWRDIAAALLGTNQGLPAQPSPLLGDLVEECLADLVQSLFGTEGSTEHGTPESLQTTAIRQGYGSGILIGKIGQDSSPIGIAMGGAVVENCLGPRPAAAAKQLIAGRAAAIRGGKLHLEVVLGEAEIRLGDLAQIAVGDILRLQSSYKEPVAARNGQGQTMFRGYLGTQGASKAIQVISKEK